MSTRQFVTRVAVRGVKRVLLREAVRRGPWVLGAAAGLVAWRALRGRGSLRGNVVLVTGSSRGLGLHLARELASRGARLVLCARDIKELVEAQKDLAATGAEVVAIPCDVADPTAVAEMVREATSWYGRIDVLINNAGIMRVGPLESMTVADFHAVMDVNFWGTLYTTMAVLPQMRLLRHGRIVNITSIGARIAFPHLAPYTAAKFAQFGFSQGLRAELAGTGIRVTTVVPGFMRTGSQHHAEFRGQAPLEYAWFASGGASPLTSMDARRAARKIVRACERGDSHVTLGVQTKLVRLLHDVAPGLTARALALVGRLLPSAEGTTGRLVSGREATEKTPGVIERRVISAAEGSNQELPESAGR